METIKTTILGNSYWNSNGAYQAEYDKLYNEHVPVNGNAKTLNGELIRAISRLFYEYCNNGNCNAGEIKYDVEELTCPNCGGSGIEYGDGDEEMECAYCYGTGYTEEEYIADTYVTEMFENFLKLIETNVEPYKTGSLEMIRDIITEHDTPKYYNDKYMERYNKMCDNVIYYVLNNEDKELPEWYLNTINCK